MARAERSFGAGRAVETQREPRAWWRSRIVRMIFASNLAGLLILIAGALLVNEVRAGLVRARMDSLQAQARFYEDLVSQAATEGEPEAVLIPDNARSLLRILKTPDRMRVRVFNLDREVVADSDLLDDRIESSDLRPVAPRIRQRVSLKASRVFGDFFDWLSPESEVEFVEARSLREEFRTALTGEIAASQRFSERGVRLISVSVPVKHISKVVGVLTVEASDVQDIVRAERAALLPIIGVAVLVATVTSILLGIGIARPLRRLSIAADRVRTGVSEKFDMPQLSARKDELGDLAQALEEMTGALRDRIELNERFAADVAHELKNPLTSIRSAVETAETVPDEAVRSRMREVIAKDVKRLDRLITDISNASRLEAEIIRDPAGPIDMGRLLRELSSIWRDTRKESDPEVSLLIDDDGGDLVVKGREGPLSQVISNLVENARSFSPTDGVVSITARHQADVVVITIEDDGPGLPADKLEKIFERFYSDRPKGTQFGNNSGLGLSIVKQIVETHRGEVYAENRVRNGNIVGARFVVRLPFNAQT